VTAAPCVILTQYDVFLHGPRQEGRPVGDQQQPAADGGVAAGFHRLGGCGAELLARSQRRWQARLLCMTLFHCAGQSIAHALQGLQRSALLFHFDAA